MFAVTIHREGHEGGAVRVMPELASVRQPNQDVSLRLAPALADFLPGVWGLIPGAVWQGRTRPAEVMSVGTVA